MTEIGHIDEKYSEDLQEAIAAGVFALTSVDQRASALRTALISIQR